MLPEVQLMLARVTVIDAALVSLFATHPDRAALRAKFEEMYANVQVAFAGSPLSEPAKASGRELHGLLTRALDA